MFVQKEVFVTLNNIFAGFYAPATTQRVTIQRLKFIVTIVFDHSKFYPITRNCFHSWQIIKNNIANAIFKFNVNIIKISGVLIVVLFFH